MILPATPSSPIPTRSMALRAGQASPKAAAARRSQPCPCRHRRSHGYILLELLLALIIFMIAVAGMAGSLRMAMQTANILSRENDVRIGMRSFLEEVRRKPLTEMNQSFTDPRLGITFTSQTEETRDIKDRNGTILRNLYKLRVATTYEAGGEMREEAVEAFVYKTQEERTR